MILAELKRPALEAKLTTLTDMQLVMLALFYTEPDCVRPSCIDDELARRIPLTDWEWETLNE